MKLQNKLLGKIVIVPHHKGKPFQFHFYRYTKWVLLSCTLVLLLVFGWAYYQYRYYTDKLLSLLNDNTVTNLSMNQISLDGIEIKRELIRLKRESDAMDKFITQAKQFDKDAFAGLSLLYSTKTFPDFFRSHAKTWDASHPASSTDLPVETKDKATILKESAERQKNLPCPDGCHSLGLSARRKGNSETISIFLPLRCDKSTRRYTDTCYCYRYSRWFGANK